MSGRNRVAVDLPGESAPRFGISISTSANNTGIGWSLVRPPRQKVEPGLSPNQLGGLDFQRLRQLCGWWSCAVRSGCARRGSRCFCRRPRAPRSFASPNRPGPRCLLVLAVRIGSRGFLCKDRAAALYVHKKFTLAAGTLRVPGPSEPVPSRISRMCLAPALTMVSVPGGPGYILLSRGHGSLMPGPSAYSSKGVEEEFCEPHLARLKSSSKMFL